MIAKGPLVSGRVFAALVLVLGTAADRASAESPPAKVIVPAPAKSNVVAADVALRLHEPARDPTAPSPLLRGLLRPAGKQSKMPDLPLIQIKARMIGGLQPNSALLQIGPDDQQPSSLNAGKLPRNAAPWQHGNRSYLVRKGTELMIPGGGFETQTIRVMDVTPDEVRIEVSPLGRVLTLN